MNPMKHVELKHQVNELFWKGFIQNSFSHCAILALRPLRMMDYGVYALTIDPSIR